MFKIATTGGLLALTVFVSGATTAAQAQNAPTASTSAAPAVYVPAAKLPQGHWAYQALNRVWSAASGTVVTETVTERPRLDFARATVQMVRRLGASPADVQARLKTDEKQALASLVREFAPEIAGMRTDTKALTATLARLGVAAPQLSAPGVPLRDTPFADVPTDHWAFNSVEKVRKAGVVQGYPGGQGGSAQASKARVATTAPRPK